MKGMKSMKAVKSVKSVSWRLGFGTMKVLSRGGLSMVMGQLNTCLAKYGYEPTGEVFDAVRLRCMWVSLEVVLRRLSGVST